MRLASWRASAGLARRLSWLAPFCLNSIQSGKAQARPRQEAAHAGTDGVDSSGLPLQTTRVVHFRATEGTWMSLDVSPDGRTIVFDLLGDLYTMPAAGGHARKLTSGTALNRQPRFAPDGRHLAFVSDRSGSQNLWIADANGRHPRQISNLHGYVYGAVTSPAWSPDGRTIVVAQQLGASRVGAVGASRVDRWLLASYDLAGGQMRWISDTASDRARAALGPEFGCRAGWIYAAVDVFRPDALTNLENWRLARVELATGRIEPEMDSRVRRAGMRPVVSRDGRYLVYATSSGSRLGLRLRDLSTQRERWLVREALDNPSDLAQLTGGDLVPGYAFMPDSKTLIAAYEGRVHRIDVTSGRTNVIPFVAGIERGLGPLTIHQFTISDLALPTRNVLQPALSPDGNFVTFSALDRIWVMELPHDGQLAGLSRRLTADSVGEFYPSWSPDGRWIAYSTWKDGDGGAVRRARLTSVPNALPVTSERLTRDPALYFNTAVDPNGERVAAVRVALPPDRMLASTSQLLDPSLVWVPVDGGSPRAITPLAEEQKPGRYLVDQVYFTADPNRVYVGLTSWAPDGTNRRPGPALSGLVTGRGDAAETEETADGVFSPDSRRLLITRRHTLFELGLPTSVTDGLDTMDLERARTAPFGASDGAAHRWGTALRPWVSWSRDGRRVLFNQGGTLFVGNVEPGHWIAFTRVAVRLLVPVDTPRGTLLLHGARLITMRGREIIERGDLVVRDNRIVAVGHAGHVAIPAEARVLDVTGKTILPGYVDLHDHMMLPKGVHPQQCWGCLVRLAYGVTTTRDPLPNFGTDVFTYSERERAGDLLGPRLFSTGMPYFGTDPPVRTAADAQDAVRPNAEYFRSETFKMFADPATGRRAWQLLSTAATDAGLNVTVHGQGLDIYLTVVIDGFSGLEHAPDVRIV